MKEGDNLVFFLDRLRTPGACRSSVRFTQSILEALSSVTAISKEGRLTEYVWSPALQAERFTFSSGTEF